jgi:hypothetical protein
MANDDVTKRMGTGCAATLGFFIAMPIGCAGGAAVGFLIGKANHVGDAVMPPELWMTLLGALVGPVVAGAAYFFVMITFLRK